MPLRRYMTSQKHSTWSHTGRRKVDQEGHLLHWSVPIRWKPCRWCWGHGIVSKVFASQARGSQTRSQNSQKEGGCGSAHFNASTGERRQGACWSLMAATIVYLKNSRIRKDFVPLPFQNLRKVLRINILACPLASTNTHVPICPPTHEHTHIQRLWICGFVAIGTDIKELVEKEMLKVNFVLLVTPNSSCLLSAQQEVGGEGLAFRDRLLSTTWRDRRKSGVSTECL